MLTVIYVGCFAITPSSFCLTLLCLMPYGVRDIDRCMLYVQICLIRKFKHGHFVSHFASRENWLPFVLAAVDLVVNKTIAYDKIPLITACTVSFIVPF